MNADADRRRFLRQLGIALAGMAVAGTSAAGCCSAGAEGVVEPVTGAPDVPGVGGTERPPVTGWGAVRRAWGDLDRLAKLAEDAERGEKERDAMAKDHRSALDGLVAAGEVEAGVADDIQLAFDEAAHHVWRSNAPISCYEPVAWPQYDIDAASSLARQAELLEQHSAGLDQATADAARQAIERDIAFLSLDTSSQQEIQRVEAGGTWRSLPELELDAPAESKEAAALLVQVLSGQR